MRVPAARAFDCGKARLDFRAKKRKPLYVYSVAGRSNDVLDHKVACRAVCVPQREMHSSLMDIRPLKDVSWQERNTSNDPLFNVSGARRPKRPAHDQEPQSLRKMVKRPGSVTIEARSQSRPYAALGVTQLPPKRSRFYGSFTVESNDLITAYKVNVRAALMKQSRKIGGRCARPDNGDIPICEVLQIAMLAAV